MTTASGAGSGCRASVGRLGHVLDMVQAPIYATGLTRGLLEVKLKRSGKLGEAELNTINAGDRLQIGPFDIETFHVCHSIPDGIGMGISTPAGLIVHSGDYKFDHTPVDNWPTDYAMLAEFAGRGVLALLADSTNADRPGWTPSERVIDPAFFEVFHNAPGRIIISSFASLISRMQQVGNAAKQAGRKLAFVGMSMKENAKMARKLGYLNLPDNLVVNLDQALKMKDHEIVLMCTGTQGEPTSILGRLQESVKLYGQRAKRTAAWSGSSAERWKKRKAPIDRAAAAKAKSLGKPARPTQGESRAPSAW